MENWRSHGTVLDSPSRPAPEFGHLRGPSIVHPRSESLCGTVAHGGKGPYPGCARAALKPCAGRPIHFHSCGPDLPSNFADFENLRVCPASFGRLAFRPASLLLGLTFARAASCSARSLAGQLLGRLATWRDNVLLIGHFGRIGLCRLAICPATSLAARLLVRSSSCPVGFLTGHLFGRSTF